MAFYIITDCAADLPDDIIEKYGIDVVRMAISCGDETYFDGTTLKSKDLMARMRNGEQFKTSQCTSQAFVECIEKYAQNGDSVLYIAFSTGLSGSYNSANIARDELLEEYPEFDFTIIDTKCASMGYGMVVYKALVMKENGASMDKIIEAVKFNSEHMEHIFTVDDLEYLFRGGRVSRTAAIVGGLFGIKPVLDVDDDGKLRPIEKVRGRKNSIKRMAELVGQRGVNLDKQIIGISHGDDMVAVEDLKQLLTDNYGCSKFIVNDIGCAVGSHAGPGTLAVFFLDTDSPYENN